MDCKSTDRIAFKQQLFAREELSRRWPALNKYISSTTTLEAAYINTEQLIGNRLEISRGTAQEALDFYNKVVQDGRYIDRLLEAPQEVAEKLKLPLSEDAIKRLVTVNELLPPGGTVMNIAVVAVAVAVTVVIVKGIDPLEELVIDQRGFVRL